MNKSDFIKGLDLCYKILILDTPFTNIQRLQLILNMKHIPKHRSIQSYNVSFITAYERE